MKSYLDWSLNNKPKNFQILNGLFLSLCPIYWETNDLLTSAFLRSVVRPSTKRSIWLPWLWNSSIGRRILIWRLSSIIVPKPCSAAAQTRLFIQYCIFTYFVRTDARTHCSTYRLDGQVCINIGVVDLLFFKLGSCRLYFIYKLVNNIRFNTILTVQAVHYSKVLGYKL